MIQLDPGMYEIGRDDGSIDPFLICVGESGMPYTGTRITSHYFECAISVVDGPWWFRYISVPTFLPIDKHGRWCIPLPPASRP